MIKVNESKCIGCNACIRTCPVPNANHYADGVVHVNTDECIQCGECVKGCRHGARYYTDDLEEVLSLAKTNKVSLIVAPAIKTALDSKWRHVLQWLKENGIHEVFDGAFGADICTYMHIKYLERNPGKKIVSQPCAAIVNYVEKHRPEMIPHMSPVQSPLMCSAVYIRKYLKNNDILVGLTPCLAKGDEFRNTGIVSYNVTFKSLSEYINRHGVHLATGYSPFEFSDIRGFDGAFYPIPGGLKECLRVYAPDLSVTTSEGVNKVYDDFDIYLETDKSRLPVVYDVLSCEFGCNSGAGAREDFNTFNAYDIMINAKGWANQRKRSVRFHSNVFKTLKLEDFLRGYKDRSTSARPSVAEINNVFNLMEKHTDADRHIDCHACGYKSCQHMAMTILAGNNTPSNCVVYEKNQMLKMKSDVEKRHESLNNAVREIQQSLAMLNERIQPIAESAADNSVKNSNIKEDMGALNTDMINIHSKAGEIVSSVSEIGVSLDEYNKILLKIKNISEQTNILAINASIEAARAGEHGKGFSVVASEVRNLAVKSSDTLKEAEEYTNQILSNISGIKTASAGIMDEVNETQTGVARTDEAVDAMNESSKVISDSVSDVSSVIEELNSIVTELVASESE